MRRSTLYKAPQRHTYLDRPIRGLDDHSRVIKADAVVMAGRPQGLENLPGLRFFSECHHD